MERNGAKALCVSPRSPISFLYIADTTKRRTYGENIGEDIREGYEPTDDVAVVDPKEDEEGGNFTVGEDEDISPAESEESQQWKEAREPEIFLKPKYGLEGEEFENVWGSGEPSEPPRENP